MDDEFAPYLDEAMQNPEFGAAYSDARASKANSKTSRTVQTTNAHFVLDLLLALRKDSGLTQADVARRMGVSQPTVSDFERESNDPHVSTLQRYARAVGAELRFMVDPVATEDPAARSGDESLSTRQTP